MNYKIEKDVSMPTRHFNQRKYPFGSMDVGDSFDAGEYTQKAQMSMSGAVAKWIDKNDIAFDEEWKFETRKTEDSRLRIWRTK